MTVSSTLSRQTFACDGTTRIFTLPFRVLAATEVVGFRITIADNSAAELTNGVDFTVASVGAANAVVTTTAAYSNLYQVRFIRSTQRLQPTDYRDNDPFPAESHEEALDRLTHIAQELDGITSRAVVFPEPESGQTLPASTSRAGQLLGFDSDGDLALVSIPAVDGIIGTTWGSQQIVATAGQTVFDLSGISYVVGTNSLAVLVDGIDQNVGADYTETSSTRVTFASGLLAGQRVKFRTGRYITSGVPLASVGKGMAEDTAGGASDAASYRFRRRATYAGGTPGFVNAALFVDTFVEATPGGASTAAAFEWAGCFVVHNRSSAGENVGLYRQGIKYAGAGPTWAGTDEIIDWQTDPTTGAVGCELSFTANGTDANSARVAYDIALRKRDAAGASPVAAWGYRIQTEAGSKFVRGFGFNTGATADVGFDTSLGTINTAAFKMAAGQAISFNAGDTRKVYHDGTGIRFADGANTIIAKLTDAGALQTAAGVQVVGARQTGWGAATGTATRTTFATGSVTTAQLAERVKALIDDLTTHGLIGA